VSVKWVGHWDQLYTAANHLASLDIASNKA
jgi:hypothetical protein